MTINQQLFRLNLRCLAMPICHTSSTTNKTSLYVHGHLTLKWIKQTGLIAIVSQSFYKLILVSSVEKE